MLRLMEQIITITLIVFCLLVIYNLFSFQYGFALLYLKQKVTIIGELLMKIQPLQ